MRGRTREGSGLEDGAPGEVVVEDGLAIGLVNALGCAKVNIRLLPCARSLGFDERPVGRVSLGTAARALSDKAGGSTTCQTLCRFQGR